VSAALPAPARRRRVAIAGATGFVGRALVAALSEEYDVIALGRRGPEGAGPERVGVSRRRCDLFSLDDVEQALAGVDVAVYLVHSMMPSARLTQGRFEDLDLVLADNCGRAAAHAGVRRIVYLGGLVPRESRLSAHLRSRLEVESALGAHGVPVTAVRAGLVVGAGGSSLRILVRLVERLPIMLCPRWTATRTQPIALDDAVEILRACIEDPAVLGRVCEVGGPDVMSYREMMQATAEVLGRRRLLLPVPFFSPGLSRLWVSLVTGTPRSLVKPLIQSLRYPMVARDRWLQRSIGRDGQPFREALRRAIRGSEPDESRRARLRREDSTVRSVQRLPLPAGWDASRVAREYASWLPRFFRVFLRVERDGARTRFRTRLGSQLLLELEYLPRRSAETRAIFAVTRGLLVGRTAERPGCLEFRAVPDGEHVLAAVHDFRPRLPWMLYRASQAWVHLWVMRSFARHLDRVAG
jgi:uncharacterized protein YbjT (DUF2867 family)